jgi:phospholipase D1/2
VARPSSASPGPRVAKLRAKLQGGGVAAMAAMRLLPLGPFTFVNVACGAAGLKRRDFLLGTTIVMIPVLILMALAVSVVPSLRDYFLK